MTDLRLLNSVRHFFANTDLNCIDTISFLGFNLRYLTPVDLNDSAGSEFAPFVPKVSHSNFVAHQTHALRKSADRRHRSYWVVFVNFIFKGAESLGLVSYSILL